MLLYHGTKYVSACNIVEYGIDFKKCDRLTDNARGFYLSAKEEFAAERARFVAGSEERAAQFFVAFNRTGLEHFAIMNSFFPGKLHNLNFMYDVVIDIPADARISQKKEILEAASKQESGVWPKPNFGYAGKRIDIMEKRVLAIKKESHSLKAVSLSAIKQILVRQYGVSEKQARQMMTASGVEHVFDRNVEMAAHTSYRTWAQRIYEQFRIQDTATPVQAPGHVAVTETGGKAVCLVSTRKRRRKA